MNIRAQQSACPARIPHARLSTLPPEVWEYPADAGWRSLQQQWRRQRHAERAAAVDLARARSMFRDRTVDALCLASPFLPVSSECLDDMMADRMARCAGLFRKAQEMEDENWEDDVCADREPARQDPRRPRSSSPPELRALALGALRRTQALLPVLS